MGKGGIVGRPTQTRFGRVGAGGGNPADRGGFPQQVNDLIVCRNGSASQPTFNRLWLRDYPVRAGNPGFPLWVVCHERANDERRCDAVREMRVGPSRSRVLSGGLGGHAPVPVSR